MAKRQRGATRQMEQKEASRIAPLLLRMVVLASLIGGIGWGVNILREPERFPLRTVRIESKLTHVTQQEIRDAVAPHVKQGFLHIDVDAIRSALETIAWVDRATVRRAWPDVLVVRVSEQQALARWGQQALVNPRGEIFSPKLEESWQQLPLLRGPEATQQMVTAQFVAMQGMVAPLGLSITHMTVNERRAMTVRLSNGLQLGLGRQDKDLRLLRFVRAYPQVIKPRLTGIDSVDLRYTNGFAVRWREGFGPAAA